MSKCRCAGLDDPAAAIRAAREALEIIAGMPEVALDEAPVVARAALRLLAQREDDPDCVIGRDCGP